jgi:hypothetical protein
MGSQLLLPLQIILHGDLYRLNQRDHMVVEQVEQAFTGIRFEGFWVFELGDF